MQKRYLPNRRPKTIWRTFWQLRYRFYGIVVILILLPILYSSNANIPQNIDVFGYTVENSTFIADKIKKIPLKTDKKDDKKSENTGNSPKFGELQKQMTATELIDLTGPKITEELKNANYNLGNLTADMLIDLGYKGENLQTEKVPKVEVKKEITLQDLIKKPENPQRTSFLRYPRFNVNAPIIYSTFEDLFELKADCNPEKDELRCLNFQKPLDTSETTSPVQMKLRDGPLHMALSPPAGEIGNSYIVGHSSNFPWIKSNYNKVFAPLEKASKVGDEFTIYDKDGRELKFRVFEVKQIVEADTKTAYENFGPERRIVTLQTSILTQTINGILPTHRWLTRGELILEK